MKVCVWCNKPILNEHPVAVYPEGKPPYEGHPWATGSATRNGYAPHSPREKASRNTSETQQQKLPMKGHTSFSKGCYQSGGDPLIERYIPG